MKKTIFTGMATAIVTPMTADGIDYEALGRFLEFQIENGINAIVVMGTTGENATIEYEDQKEVIRFTVEKVNHRVPVIAGTGTNNTAHVLSNTKNACEVGADAVLVVTPYYNKATQNGLYQFFTTIADASRVPVILYNVPSRTGVNLLPATVAKLAEHPNIVAVKEATGNVAQMEEIRVLCGDKIDIYSGEDALTQDYKTAAELQLKLLPLTNALFSEVNPIPAKAAVSAMGFGEEHIRLPLTPMEDDHRAVLFAEMRKLGVKV